MSSLKPWSWTELSKIASERGENFDNFVADYGIRGKLALELARMPEDTGVCVLSTDFCCVGCKLRKKECEPATKAGKENLARWYMEELITNGRLPQ